MGSTYILSHTQSIPWSGTQRIDLFGASGKHEHEFSSIFSNDNLCDSQLKTRHIILNRLKIAVTEQ